MLQLLCIFEHYESVSIFAISISVLCKASKKFSALCYLAPLGPFLDPPLHATDCGCHRFCGFCLLPVKAMVAIATPCIKPRYTLESPMFGVGN
jgi:hypothetical protein